MEDSKIKEYNSVVLAALLHDIGKLLHRGTDAYEGKHEKASFDFLNKFEERLKNDGLYDLELIKLLVRHHHSSENIAIEDIKLYDENDIRRVWNLIRIIQDSDSYSCAERDIKQQWKRDITKKKSPLDSIFSNVNLDIVNPLEKISCKYKLTQLDPLTGFPTSIKSLSEKDINTHIDNFEKNIPDFTDYNSFDDVLNQWLNILEKFTWAVPSDTRYEVSDVSLYDHLRTSAAFAACLYQRRFLEMEKGKNRFDRAFEFFLIGGDFSGIQNYIFDITEKGSGGVSKRLRARSFFITLFLETTTHKILHKLQLPIVCNLFSAGGKFLLLYPNIAGAENLLIQVKTEIEKEIHETYFTLFSFIMSWMPINCQKKDNQLKVYTFFKIADDMFHKLEDEKTRKTQTILVNPNTGLWNEDAFQATKMYNNYNSNGDCKICGKGPAIYEDKDHETGEITMCCNICYRDKFLIGMKLPKTKYVSFSKGPLENEDEKKKIIIFHKNSNTKDKGEESYSVELLSEYRETENRYLIYNLGDNHQSMDRIGYFQPIKKHIANHVPLDKNGNIINFQEIAKFSRWKNGEKKKGSDLLGVLKADIDNLGLIFSKGFEVSERFEKNLDDIDKKTVSRFLTMARMIELFFSGWNKKIMSENNMDQVFNELNTLKNINKDRLQKYLTESGINFNHIYTVYAGGDDMVLVGPWETMIVFSIFLDMKFRQFTCNNQFITLSAGLSFVKSTTPIATAVHQAETLLEKSKAIKNDEDSGKRSKDSITLFGTTVQWTNMPKLIDFFLFLNEKINNDESNINTSFLHRLNKYHLMAIDYIHNRNLEGLKFLSTLSYDIGRNIIEWDKNQKIKKGLEESQIFQSLLNEKINKESLIYNIKIPLIWTLYHNRGLKNEHPSNI